MAEGLLNVTATQEPQIVYSQWAIYLALVFCILFILVGIFGNALTVMALLKSRKLRSAATSFFIVSLCITDLIFCAFSLPIIAVRYAYQSWILGDFLCKLFPFFFYLNVAASVFTIAAITINRYVLIAHYRTYDRIYRKVYIGLMIGICWLFPFALLIPPMTESWGRFGYNPHTFSCTVLRSENGKSPKKFFFALGFFLPVVVIVVCYTRIYAIVRKSKKNILSHSSPTANRSQTKESMTLTRMVLVIFGVFMICYLPLLVANVVDDKDQYPDFHVIASILAWSASVVNPFIYGFMSTRYRNAYASILPFCRCSKKMQISTVTATSSSGLKTSTIAGQNSIKMSESFPSGQGGRSNGLNTSNADKSVENAILTA